MQRSILFVVVVSVLAALLSAPGAQALVAPLNAPAPRAARGKSPLLEPVHRGSREGRYGPGMEGGRHHGHHHHHHHHHPESPRSDSGFVKYQKRAMLEPVQRANSRARYPPSVSTGDYRANYDGEDDSSLEDGTTSSQKRDGVLGVRSLVARLSGAGKRMIDMFKFPATA